MGLNAKQRIKLAERSDMQCYWCDQKVRKETGWQNSATIEHLIPSSQGGSNRLVNLVCACHRCNRLRGTQDVDSFKALAVSFEPDCRLTTEAQQAEKKLNRQLKQQNFKQIVGNDKWSYAHVPDRYLNAKERLRKDRTRVRQALKVSTANPFEPNTRCHRLFEAELARISPHEPTPVSIWTKLVNKLTSWHGQLYSALRPLEKTS
jgi:hypothetical protein